MSILDLEDFPPWVFLVITSLATYIFVCFFVELAKVFYNSYVKYKKYKKSQLNKEEIKLFFGSIKKFFIISIAIVGVIIFGFIFPSIIMSPAKLGTELNGSFRRAMEPFGGFLLTARKFEDKNNQYQNRCFVKSERILMQSYTWMMIPGPVIEACVSIKKNEQGEIEGLHSLGMIKKRAYDPKIDEWRNRIKSPLKIEEIMELSKLKFGPTASRINEAIEEAINNGTVPNEHDAAKEYLFKIKDEYLKYAQEWEKV